MELPLTEDAAIYDLQGFIAILQQTYDADTVSALCEGLIQAERETLLDIVDRGERIWICGEAPYSITIVTEAFLVNLVNRGGEVKRNAYV